jgi:hypothetical protein
MSKPKKVYFTLQGKGGISKSTVSVWLHQFLLSKGAAVKGFDTDPTNSTFNAFKGLDVDVIQFMEKNQINQRGFDALIESILKIDVDCIIVDNGATSFNPILAYINENSIFEFLKSNGIEPIVNTICAGGSEHIETMKGIKYLYDTTDATLLVWMNHYFGNMPAGDLEPVRLLKENLTDRLVGIIDIPYKNSDTFGKDIQETQSLRLTFDEYIEKSSTGILPAHRMKMFKNELFSEISSVKM